MGGHARDRLATLIAKYGGRVPRYTSYPTAVQFSPAVGPSEGRAWLERLRRTEGAVSVYLHIPFCARMCWYCGCHTKAVNQHSVVADYVEDLIAEIDLAAGALTQRLTVGAVHFGGGTPNMLSADELQRILARLAAKFDVSEATDIAVEVDPRLLTRAWADAAVRAGVKRASLGVQDFDPAVQAAINRIQPYDTVARAVDDLRAAGVDSINLDLMYGLPQQSLASLATTVDQALRLAPDRLSLFGYAHVPWLKPHQKLLPEAQLPDPHLRLSMQRRAAELFEAAGFIRIGLDHFARADDDLAVAARSEEVRRNFQGYTTDAAPVLLGFGASAIGHLPQGYVQNTTNVAVWRAQIASGKLPVARGCELSADDRLRAEIIERLMCDFCVDLDAVAARHQGRAEFAQEYERLAEMATDGLVRLDGSKIMVTPDGRDFVRSVCAVFDRHLDPQNLRHSQGV